MRRYTPRNLIDFTGVGRPVFDIFKEQGIRAKGVNITAGMQVSREPHGWNVAKQILVSTVQAELHVGRLQIDRNLKEASILTRELQDFQVSITPRAAPTYWQYSRTSLATTPILSSVSSRCPTRRQMRPAFREPALTA